MHSSATCKWLLSAIANLCAHAPGCRFSAGSRFHKTSLAVVGCKCRSLILVQTDLQYQDMLLVLGGTAVALGRCCLAYDPVTPALQPVQRNLAGEQLPSRLWMLRLDLIAMAAQSSSTSSVIASDAAQKFAVCIWMTCAAGHESLSSLCHADHSEISNRSGQPILKCCCHDAQSRQKP